LSMADDAEPRPVRRRPGKSATASRILDSAQQLFAKRGPAAVSIRQVAEQAGVSHALVHKYFGSKDDLINAVVYRADAQRSAAAEGSPSLKDVYRELLPQVMSERDHSMMLVRSAMSGVEYVPLADRIKTTGALIELARRTAASDAAPAPPPLDIDPRVLIGAITSMILGWSAIEDWLWHITGLDPADKDEVYRQLFEIVDYMADLTLVGDEVDAAGPAAPQRVELEEREGTTAGSPGSGSDRPVANQARRIRHDA
jgi:TetR/AcrR family transcriptional regulator, repressor for neighboring sulfatase